MSDSVDARINDIMSVQKGKAFRTTTWRRFARGMDTHEITEAFHDSACNIPEYSDIDHALVVDVIRGRINWYLKVKRMTVEQVAGKVGQPASLIREIMQGGDNIGAIMERHPAPEIEESPRPVRPKGKRKAATKQPKKAKINDEAADQVVVTVQAILDREIAEDHVDIVLRGLARFAYEQRLPFAEKLESGLQVASSGKVPLDIALLGVLDIASE